MCNLNLEMSNSFYLCFPTKFNTVFHNLGTAGHFEKINTVFYLYFIHIFTEDFQRNRRFSLSLQFYQKKKKKSK